MIGVWLLATYLLFNHASVVRGYLDIVGQLGLRGATSPGTPFQQGYPAFAADAQTWTRHAISLLEGDSLRLRYTQIDNAPGGREVHWNSAWAWTIASAGWLNHWLTGVPLTLAMERTNVWLNPIVLSLLIVGLSGWAAQRSGTIAGVVVALAMVGHPRIFEGFFPSYVDHHGLLTVAVFGMMLGATFMGAGWWQAPGAGEVRLLPATPESARRAAAFSGLSGALGLWMSAASIIAPIAIVGCAGVVAMVAFGRNSRRNGPLFDPVVWRTWGRVGGAGSVVFYLVEYFPSHMGLRLESNHPFYGLAWWAAGELIAEAGTRWLAPASERWSRWPRLVAPAVAVTIAPLSIWLGGPSVFVVMDPFLAELHRRHIQEFLPLWRSLQGMGWKTFYNVVGVENIPLLVGVGTLVVQRRNAPVLLWFATIATALFTAMAWAQSRWLLNASGSQICLALVLLGVWFANKSSAARYLAGLAVGLVLFFPPAITRISNGKADVAARRVSPKDAHSALSRDIAAAIRKSQPTGEITLLTSPNSSTSIGYYGRFKTLGTLYWENSTGLKAAAALLSAQTSDEAAALVKKYGVTHIAMISEENFIEQYYRLLNPAATVQQVQQCFGHQLLYSRVIPPWLQMLPYKVPDDLGTLNTTVMLFKVAFEQSAADALYHIAQAKVAMGTLAEAEADFDTLIRLSPDSYQPYLRKGELAYVKQDWNGAADLTIAGIQRAPQSIRGNLFAEAAGSFYRDRRYAQVVRIYRAALAESFQPQLAAYLAFVLATAKDDQVRNGAEALTLAERALASDPTSPTFLNSLAAAQAESGLYADAAATARKALANARAQGDAPAQRVSEQRLTTFEAGKPWRE